MASITSLRDHLPNLPGLDLAQNRMQQAALQWAMEEHEKCKRTRLQFERQWFINLAFYFGKQYYQWTSDLGPIARLVEPAAPPWRVRAVSNKIKPICRTEHAKLNKEHPQPFVIPATTDDADLKAARAAEHITEHLWREYKLNKLIRRSTFWQVITGNGFIKDWWDPNSKDEREIPGIIRWENVTPFHFFVPSMLEEELDNQPYVIHSVAKTPFYIKRVYGKTLIPQKSNSGDTDSIMTRVYQALGMQQDGAEVIHVNEMTIKESEHFPEGGKIVWAQDQILDLSMEWPHVYDDYNFSHMTHVPTGRFYADSVIPDLIPLQKEYNRTKSQIIEAKNLTAKPQFRAPKGSVDVSKITSEPGLVIFYQPGLEPIDPMPIQSIPNYVLDSLDLIQRDMDDISSQHEVTKGRTPPGVSAATAIAYLQEEDDSKLAASVASIEEAVERVGSHTLRLVKEYWTEERIVRITGKEEVYEAYQFKGADLRDNTSLSVEAGSASPRSKAAKQAFLMELGKMGWIPPDKALRYLDMAEAGTMYRDMQIDMRHAQRENITMMQNYEELHESMEDEDTGMDAGTLEVNAWDNHQAHIQEHNDFRKRQAFQELPELAQEVFDRHVMLHEQLTAMQMGMPLDPGSVLPAELDPGVGEIPLGAGMGEEEITPQVPDMGGEMGGQTELPPSGGPQPAAGQMPSEGEAME